METIKVGSSHKVSQTSANTLGYQKISSSTPETVSSNHRAVSGDSYRGPSPCFSEIAKIEKDLKAFFQFLKKEPARLLQDLKSYPAFKRQILVKPNGSNLQSEIAQESALCKGFLQQHFLNTGAIIASTDKAYYFDWGRDASMVMNALLDLNPNAPPGPKTTQEIESQLNYDQLFRQQAMEGKFPGGLGEARTLVSPQNGSLWAGPWGTPQFDAPALKVYAFSKFGLDLLAAGNAQDKQIVQQQIYPGVQQYLNYLIQNQGKPCFDLWEEINAQQHFWTEMSEAVAFNKGAELAKALGDSKNAALYQNWSKKIQTDIRQVFLQDTKDRIIFPDYQVLNPGSAGKTSILDSSVLGGLLLGKSVGYPIKLDNPYALHTFSSLLTAFKNLYPINKNSNVTAIGRYPDDQYGGPGVEGQNEGNPWIISTLWEGQYDYELAAQYLKEGKINLQNGRKADLENILGFSLPGSTQISENDPVFYTAIQTLMKKGDDILQWTLNHTHNNGMMSEQIDKNTGKPTSVQDLAWSYAEFLEAVKSRNELEALLRAHSSTVRAAGS